MSVVEIKRAVEALSPEELAEISAFVARREAEIWDKRIEADSLAGKLDHLIEEARSDYTAGRCRSLDDLVNDS